jgi:hypothetical protein
MITIIQRLLLSIIINKKRKNVFASLIQDEFLINYLKKIKKKKEKKKKGGAFVLGRN